MAWRDVRMDEQRARRRMLREQPISRLFPNLITIAGLCCGLSAIRFALLERWEIAVAFILAAALIDGMDGRIARMLGATSVFGAQLDSLSDFLCFGIAPAMLMYLWGLHEIRGLGWAVTLFYAVCCALRLARFNTALSATPDPPWKKQFFVGVPSPAGGLLCLWPMVLFLALEHQFQLPAWYCLVHVLAVGVLMVSRIPTFAAKNIRIKPEMVLPFTAAAAALVVLLIIEAWWTITVISAMYLVSIYFSYRRYRQLSEAMPA